MKLYGLIRLHIKPYYSFSISIYLWESMSSSIRIGIQAHWALKMLNLYVKVVGEKRKLQIQKLEKLRLNAYSSSKLYNECTKKYHDKKIVERNFHIGQYVLLLNSKLRLFSWKVKIYLVRPLYCEGS